MMIHRPFRGLQNGPVRAKKACDETGWRTSQPPGRTKMGMETLHKAALAAGFVMVPPEDEPFVAGAGYEQADETKDNLPAISSPRRASAARDAMIAAAGWIKDHLPVASGGRAPA
jgi:hypothetical protein